MGGERGGGRGGAGGGGGCGALCRLAGRGGAAVSCLRAPPSQGSLGASGAVFGLLGATVVLIRRMGCDLRPILVLLALNLVITFSVPNIDWRAHVGGLVAGSGIALGMVHAPRDRRARGGGGGCAGGVLGGGGWGGGGGRGGGRGGTNSECR